MPSMQLSCQPALPNCLDATVHGMCRYDHGLLAGMVDRCMRPLQVLQETDIIAEGRIRPRSTAPAKPAKGGSEAEAKDAEAPGDQTQAPTEGGAAAAAGEAAAEAAPAKAAAPAGTESCSCDSSQRLSMTGMAQRTAHTYACWTGTARQGRALLGIQWWLPVRSASLHASVEVDWHYMGEC